MATFNLICSVKQSGAMARFTLMRNEEMKLKVQPHPLSFLHLYFVFLLLLVWGFVIHRFFSQDWFSQVPGYEWLIRIPVVNEVVAAAIIWSLALLAIGSLTHLAVLQVLVSGWDTTPVLRPESRA